jgi:hypothetical protein
VGHRAVVGKPLTNGDFDDAEQRKRRCTAGGPCSRRGAQDPDSEAPAPPNMAQRRVHSINFETATDEWVDSVVVLLREAGLPRAGRSEVVRVALVELQRTIAAQSRSEIVKFFLDRDVEWRLARLDPSDAK